MVLSNFQSEMYGFFILIFQVWRCEVSVNHCFNISFRSLSILSVSRPTSATSSIPKLLSDGINGTEKFPASYDFPIFKLFELHHFISHNNSLNITGSDKPFSNPVPFGYLD